MMLMMLRRAGDSFLGRESSRTPAEADPPRYHTIGECRGKLVGANTSLDTLDLADAILRKRGTCKRARAMFLGEDDVRVRLTLFRQSVCTTPVGRSSSSRSQAGPEGHYGYSVSGQEGVRGAKQNSRMYCQYRKRLARTRSTKTYESDSSVNWDTIPYWGSRGN